ncbi:MAG: amino acid ABC transporter substrate-binding protein [Clostridiales Family XIII bacterium]|jgi:polar amino acid transport system substrate-binding protein|nr:amino acid ABC transporter substrate-binding protein [Clostridiales Family XIII bacterium]
MLKKLLILFTVTALVCTSTGCGAKPSDGDTSLEDIIAKGEMVLGCDDSFPPMGFRDQDGEIIGFDIDLARAVAEELGVELVVRPINWDTKEMELINGNIDLIWNGYTITSGRDAEVEFSKPYLNNEQVFVVRADSGIYTPADLAGVDVGCQIQSAAESAITGDGELFSSIDELRTYDTYQDALLDLRISDRVAAVAVDRILINYEMTQLPGEYRVLDEALSVEYYGIGMRQGSVALREAIDKALDDLQADGSTGEISGKWFGEDIVIRNVEKLTQDDLWELEG